VGSDAACTDSQAAMSRAERLPPAHIRLVSTPVFISKDYFMTEDDMIREPESPEAVQSGRRAFAEQDDALPQTDELRDKIDVLFNTTIDIPAGSSGVRLTLHAKYNIDVINLRLSLNSIDGNTTAESFGTPLNSRDGMYRAAALLAVDDLPPGQYVLLFAESNAAHFNRQSSLCLPFHVTFGLSAAQYPGEAPPPPSAISKPYVEDFFPTSDTNLDISDPLIFKISLSEDALLRIEKGNFAVSLSDSNGDSSTGVTLPKSQYFLEPRVLVVVFPPYTLKWAWTYKIMLDDTVIHPASAVSGKFDFTRITSMVGTISTGHCGCDHDNCAPGGGCQCVSGTESCYTCPNGYQLSPDRTVIGPPAKALSVRTCIRGDSSSTHQPRPGPSGYPEPSPVPVAPRRTPSPPPSATDDHSSLTAAPTKAASSNTTQKPPLHTLRYVLGYSALVVMGLYTLQFAVKFRRSAQRRLMNPFRRTRGAPRPASALNDDDDENFGGENEAIVARQ
jgi:hypothetical protein